MRKRLELVAGLPMLVALAIGLQVATTHAGVVETGTPSQPDPNALAIDLDRGAAGLTRWLAAIRTRASVLMVVAHPDDEDGGMLAYQTRGLGARGILLTLNRGEGGQNAMSMDMYDALGLVRTQELLAAGRYYGVEQYWTNAIDYGFSKTAEEALQKWGHDRVLSDVVRVIRMTHPLIVTSVFVGAPTDGHGNHEVSGQMAQEAFLAAGDPHSFPEQFKEGLRPWSPIKVYARVPFFAPTKEGIYDYATDKYVPVRFFDYVHKTWLNERPSTTLEIAEGKLDPSAGLTFLQIGRQGWGYQKSQNGGASIPLPGPQTSPYHRYGSQIPAQDKEKSFYDGIDVSLAGIATLAKGDVGFLQQGLTRLSKLADEATDRYRPDNPSAIAPLLAEGLNATRDLFKEVNASQLVEPGKSNVAFELRAKEDQWQKALAISLGVSFQAVIAPEKELTGPAAIFGGPSATFTMAIPEQSFGVQTRLFNQSDQDWAVEKIDVKGSDGKNWAIRADASPSPSLTAGSETKLRFSITAPPDPALTKPYFSRPDEEQPYYNVNDERYRNLSLIPYPLTASALLSYRGATFEVRQVVQSLDRVQGVGMMTQPLLMGPPISVAISPAAGAVPLTASSFDFSCSLHSNVKGPAEGILRLQLPHGWESTPAQVPFSFTHDNETQTITVQVLPHGIKAAGYNIQAVAEYKGKTYQEGYRLVGYPGVRPYPFYRPASYRVVGVDVQTAPGLRVGFLPGTGDEVPRALQDLGLNARILSANDIESGDLTGFDAIILGVRAYTVRPELRSANGRLLEYVKNGGALIIQYNLNDFDHEYGPYHPFTMGASPQKVVDEGSTVHLLEPANPLFAWPNKVTANDFAGWVEERGHGFMGKWDSHYQALVETHDPDQDPQKGGLLVAKYGKGFYIYDAFALYRQLPSGVPGAYRLLANLVSVGKNPQWK